MPSQVVEGNTEEGGPRLSTIAAASVAPRRRARARARGRVHHDGLAEAVLGIDSPRYAAEREGPAPVFHARAAVHVGQLEPPRDVPGRSPANGPMAVSSCMQQRRARQGSAGDLVQDGVTEHCCAIGHHYTSRNGLGGLILCCDEALENSIANLLFRAADN